MKKPEILLSSVFKPFALDNEYCRPNCRPEGYHNQLTLEQGVFSLRSCATALGLHAIANNIDTPTTVLDYPTLKHFKKELQKGYKIVGLGSMMINYQKLKIMVQLTREISPHSTIIVGGFCSVIPNIKKDLGVDYVCVGEGISFMRQLLGLSPEFRFKNPRGAISHTREFFGVPLNIKRPQLLIGLGCSYGCDFCSSSHFFGKQHIQFLTTGEQIYSQIMDSYRKYPESMASLIGDDNFLLDQERAEQLRQCVIENKRNIKLYLFASADRILKFGVRRFAEMGADIVWIGRESDLSDYNKNNHIDFRALVSELKSYGIKPIISSILLMDQHTKENIKNDIHDHIACKPVFSQFLFYTPVMGTPLYDRKMKEGLINRSLAYEDYHGLTPPVIIHPCFSPEEAGEIQKYAYKKEYLELGPSLVRFIETEYTGWKNLKNDTSPVLRARADSYASKMWVNKIFLSAVKHLAPSSQMVDSARSVLSMIEKDFGPTPLTSKAAARGLYLSGRLREIRTRFWGDVIQPSSHVFHYNV